MRNVPRRIANRFWKVTRRLARLRRRYIKPLFFLAVLHLLGRSGALAGITGTLEGFVREKGTGMPLVGVNVVVVGTGQGAATNEQGFYKILNLRAGTYQIQFRMIGYRTVHVQKVVIFPDLRTKLSVEMEIGTVELSAVEITAEKPLIQTDITGSTFELSSQDLQRLPIDKFQEAIGLNPGATFDAHIRGGKVRETLYLIDGIPVQNEMSGGLGINLPRSSILQMTVKTGGFEAEYGNALSGVVNIVTQSGGEKRRFFLRADKDDLFGGTEVNKENELEFAVGGPLGESLSYFWTTNLLLSDTRWWQDMQHFFSSPIQKELNGLAKCDWLLSSAIRLSFQGIYSLARWRDYEFSWRFNLSGLPPRSEDALRLALFFTHTLSPNTFYSISVSDYFLNSRIGRGRPEDMSFVPYDYDFFLLYIVRGDRLWWADMRQNTVAFKADFTSQVHPFHLLKGGLEWRQYDIRSDIRKLEPQTTYFGKPILIEPLLNFSNQYHYRPIAGSLYLQDKFETGYDKSVFSIGLRFDFLDPRAYRPAVELIPVTQNEYREEVTGYVPAKLKYQISPRIGATLPLTEKTYFFVNYGHYFQFPLFEYLYSGLNNVQLWSGVPVLRGNPDLLTEKTTAWEFSVRHQWHADWVVSATYFYKNTINQIDTKTFVPANSRIAGDYGFASYVNYPYANADGVELLLSREKGDRFRGNISYTLMRTIGLSDYENQGLNYAQWGFPVVNQPFPLSWDQRHSIKMDLDFRLPLAIDADVVYLFHSGRPYTYYPSLDGYKPVDPEKAFLPNNRRMPANHFLNVRLSRKFLFGRGKQNRMTVYLDCRNVLDRENVRWIDSSGRVGGELGDPGAFYGFRRTQIGIQFEF